MPNLLNEFTSISQTIISLIQLAWVLRECIVIACFRWSSLRANICRQININVVYLFGWYLERSQLVRIFDRMNASRNWCELRYLFAHVHLMSKFSGVWLQRVKNLENVRGLPSIIVPFALVNGWVLYIFLSFVGVPPTS